MVVLNIFFIIFYQDGGVLALFHVCRELVFQWGLGQTRPARPYGLRQWGYPPQRTRRAFGAEKGNSQQVELKDEGGAVGGGADRQIERSSLYFSSQVWRDNFEK